MVALYFVYGIFVDIKLPIGKMSGSVPPTFLSAHRKPNAR